MNFVIELMILGKIIMNKVILLKTLQKKNLSMYNKKKGYIVEKIIKLDIIRDSDLIERYDKENINPKLIDYLINKTKFIKKNIKIKIKINNESNVEEDIVKKISEGLNKEFERVTEIQKRNDIIQLILLLIGIVFIFISTLINEKYMWKEVILIIGWVPIWEMVDLELFKDFRGKRRKRIIKKLLNSEYILK